MTENLTIWLEGVLAAVAVMACQWALGRELGRWFSGSVRPTLATQWALGVAAFGLLNALELALGLGRLIPFNALAIFLLLRNPGSALDDGRNFFKGRTLALGLIGLILLLSNALQPLWDWDAQESYVGFARHWAQTFTLDPQGLHHVYAHRPQLVSTVYAWALLWGNETSCQVLDLAFFLAGLGWLGQRLGLGNARLLLGALLACGAVVTAGAVGWNWAQPLLPSYPGRGGNDFLLFLLILALIEVLPSVVPAALLGGALLLTRWSAIPFFLIYMVWMARQREHRARILVAMAGALLVALPWYAFCHKATGNPFFPHETGFFDNRTTNALLEADFSDEGMRARDVEGVDSPDALRGYLRGAGLSMLLYLLSLMVSGSPPTRRLLQAAWILGLTSLATTSQVRFQFPAILMLGAFVAASPPRLKSRWAWNSLLIVLALTALPAAQGRLHTAWRLLADARHGRDELMEERVRLWPAMRWLNAQEGKGAVLWPMNPSYHGHHPGLRGDNAAYLMEDGDLESLRSMAEALRRMGVRWIVSAPPYYPPTEQGALVMMDVVDWMHESGGLRHVATLPKTGVSPATEILELLPQR